MHVVHSALALDCSRSVQHIARPDARSAYGALRARSARICGDRAVGVGVTAQAGAASITLDICPEGGGRFDACRSGLQTQICRKSNRHASKLFMKPTCLLRYSHVVTFPPFSAYIHSTACYAYSKSAVKCVRWASSPELKSSRSNKPNFSMRV
jgi:hypothetical protein